MSHSIFSSHPSLRIALELPNFRVTPDRSHRREVYGTNRRMGGFDLVVD